MQNGQRSVSSQDPAEGHDDVTPPERGFPGGDEDRADGGTMERIEKAEDDDANPLAHGSISTPGARRRDGSSFIACCFSSHDQLESSG